MGLTFHTGYRNLVVTGPNDRFCLVSGVHDEGFPWGDPGAVSDVLLAVDLRGEVRRFVTGGAALSGLTHRVADGVFRYVGPAFELPAGSWRVGLSDLAGPDASLGLLPVTLDVELAMEVVPLDGGTITLPFAELADTLRDAFGKDDNERLGDPDTVLGMEIDTASIRVTSGHVRISGASGETLELDATDARGEAEESDYVGLRRPSLGYHYLCAVLPDGGSNDGMISIRTDVLDPGGGGLVDDTVAHLAASLFRSTADIAITWRAGKAELEEIDGDPPMHVVEPILKLVWDGFETGVFERKISWLSDGAREFVGCEESMMLAEAYGPGSKVQGWADVWVVRDEDHRAALDAVLRETHFDELVRARAAEVGTTVEELSIALKPNFMFMYSIEDPSTYTDPSLVLALVDRLRGLGCGNISIVEAQSAYGNDFQGREVKRVAEYIGYSTEDERYRIADLTEEMEPFDYGGRLGQHFVGRTWRDAQMRISFAKNKTHSWSYYTLGIKNTYGALPMQNKLREYHTKREIYYPTIDALRHFPLHYCLVDATLSSDGQFGIFANRNPKKTDTIIGGRDAIATDWVGASKMGLHPMVSRFMREACFAFGTPEIVWRGDRSRYAPWENVYAAMAEFWDWAEERYEFSSLIFHALEVMDGHFPPVKRSWYVRVVRWLTGWIRGLIFKRPRP